MQSFEIKIRPIYGDCDKMGVVYNSNYLRYFEQGRTELMRHCGLTYSEFEQKGFILPVARAYIEYKRPLSYDVIYILRATISEINRFKIKFQYEISLENNVHTKGYTLHTCLNTEGRIIDLPEFLMKILNARST